MVEINVENRHIRYAALGMTALTFLFFLISFPSPHWIEAYEFHTTTHEKVGTLSIGLFQSEIDEKEDFTTAVLKSRVSDKSLEQLNIVILLEGIALPLLAIPVGLMYFVVFKRNVLALKISVACLTVGGIFAIAAPASFKDKLEFDTHRPLYEYSKENGYSFGLGITSGCFAFVSALLLTYSHHKDDSETTEGGTGVANPSYNQGAAIAMNQVYRTENYDLHHPAPRIYNPSAQAFNDDYNRPQGGHHATNSIFTGRYIAPAGQNIAPAGQYTASTG